MQYCTNCGSVLTEGIKFCSGCGEKVSLSSGKSKKPSKNIPDSPKMDKGVVKSLKKGVSDYAKSNIKKSITPKIPTEKLKTIHKAEKSDSSNETIGKNKSAKKLMIYYFLLNIPLYFINTGDNEILGILIFSFLIVISYLFNMKKEKPFNIVMKIILALQIVLMLASVMINLEYFFSSISTIIGIVTCIALIYVNVLLLIKGNKTS